MNRVAARANKSLGFIRHNVKTKSPQIRGMAHKTLVRPQQEYASAGWDPHTKEQSHKIEIHAIPHTVRQNLTEFGYFATHFP